MDDYHLKIRLGDYEFEATGPVEAVTAQFEAFKEIVSSLPIRKKENTAPIATAETTSPAAAALPQQPSAPAALNVDRVFRADGRVISLTVKPDSETDAVLMVLYGQRHYRNNENATGSEIIDGMALSGYREPRTDRTLSSLADEGDVIITGAHRGKRYRLTNQGYVRAQGVIRDMLAKLPQI